MVLVLFAVSVLTFLIFNVIPGGDPALRMAGRQPDPGQLEIIREEWGFNEPIYVQYVKTMEKIFTGDLFSYTTQHRRGGRAHASGLRARSPSRSARRSCGWSWPSRSGSSPR